MIKNPSLRSSYSSISHSDNRSRTMCRPIPYYDLVDLISIYFSRGYKNRIRSAAFHASHVAKYVSLMLILSPTLSLLLRILNTFRQLCRVLGATQQYKYVAHFRPAPFQRWSCCCWQPCAGSPPPRSATRRRGKTTFSHIESCFRICEFHRSEIRTNMRNFFYFRTLMLPLSSAAYSDTPQTCLTNQLKTAKVAGTSTTRFREIPSTERPKFREIMPSRSRKFAVEQASDTQLRLLQEGQVLRVHVLRYDTTSDRHLIQVRFESSHRGTIQHKTEDCYFAL